MSAVEKYLKPEVIRQIKRLDLRAQFIVKGFLQGLHASPFHGFSVEFSEHRKYTPGDDPKDIDWLVYAKTDKYYVKKFEAETNITGYLVMDLSRSMGYTYRQELTKFDYAICLAAALCYLMIHQQDPVGLLTFDEKIRQSLRPKVEADATWATCFRCWRICKPAGETDIAHSLMQVAAMLRHAQPGDDLFRSAGRAGAGAASALPAAARRARRDPVPRPRRGRGAVSRSTAWSSSKSRRRTRKLADRRRRLSRRLPRAKSRSSATTYRRECFQAGVDYVPLDTSMQFDRALTEYLVSRRGEVLAMTYRTILP